jgi:hypothetical protein
MKTTYFERWHRQNHEGIGPLDENEARERDATGAPFVVLIGDPEEPVNFIEMNRGFFGVSFLDREKREYLIYNFEVLDGNRLFLKEVIYREYDGETPRVTSATAHRFETDGRIVVESSKGTFDRAELRESRGDVRTNWEKKPPFGSYEKLIKKERTLAV